MLGNLNSLSTSICHEYDALEREKVKKRLEISLRQSGTAIDEGYIAHLEQDAIRVQARHPLGSSYGCFQLSMASLAGHVAEYLGPIKPRFPLRSLWIQGRSWLSIGEKVSVCLPKFLDTEVREDPENSAALHLFCRRIISFGFNTVIFGKMNCSSIGEVDAGEGSLDAVIAVIRSYGLKVYLKPSVVSFEDVSGIECDGLVFESPLPAIADRQARETGKTVAERVLGEVRALESSWNRPLIYYSTCQNPIEAKRSAEALAKIVDDVGPKTHIAFSAVAGSATSDYLSLNPMFDQLRVSPDESATPLMCVLNVGAIGVGEGLWPTIPLDLITRVANRLYRHPFSGMICLTSALPDTEGLLDCALWTAGQVMWQRLSPELFVETWFLGRLPGVNPHQALAAIQRAREIVVEYGNLTHREGLSAEDCRLITEGILHRLGQLKSEAPDQLQPLCRYFERDAKKALYAVVQRYQIPLAKELSTQEESFWLSSQGKWQSEPQSSEKDSAMRRILAENRLLH